MPSSLTRAALALLCAGAVLYATALFPAALDVELRQQPAPEAATPTPTPTPTAPPDTPTPTPTPTPTETPVPPPDDQSGSGLPDLSLVDELLLLLGATAAGYVALLLARRTGGAVAVDLPLFGPVPIPFAGVVQRIPQVTTAVLLTAAAGLARVAAGVGAVAGGVTRGLAGGLGPFARILGRSLAALPAALVTVALAPVRSLAALSGGGLLASLRGGFARPSVLEPDEPTTDDARTEAGVPTTSPGREASTELTVQRAWERLTDAVPVPNPEATTPAEYARAAVEAGLPETPVWQLTELFRAIAYGGESPTTSRTEAARAALDRIFGGGEDR